LLDDDSEDLKVIAVDDAKVGLSKIFHTTKIKS
jgi:hypothetical protein